MQSAKQKACSHTWRWVKDIEEKETDTVEEIHRCIDCGIRKVVLIHR